MEFLIKFLCLKVMDEFIESLLQRVILLEIKAMHDGCDDDVLREILEESVKVEGSRESSDLLTLLIDVDSLVLSVVVAVDLFDLAEDAQDDLDEVQ